MAVESLSSYLARLCVARSLTAVDVADLLLRPLVDRDVFPPRRRLSYFLASAAIEFDGMGALAVQMVRALEQLTGCGGLASHTFLPWSGLFSPSCSGALMRGGKRWCPLCFAAHHAAGVEPWEALLWRLAPATRCPRHYIRFLEDCPHCGRTQRVLTQAVPLGHCEHCARELWGRSLTQDDGKSEVHVDLDAQWEWWTSLALGRMVAAEHEAADRVDPAGFSLLLEDSRQTVGGGSMERLARHLGVQRKTATAWRDRRMPYRLSAFLAVCVRLGADPLEVAYGPYGPLFNHAWSRAGFCDAPWAELRTVGGQPRRERPLPDRTARIGQELDRAVSQGGSRSASSVAKYLGISIGALKRAFPEKYAQLTAAHTARRKRERSARLARRRKAIRQAVHGLVGEGRYPSKSVAFRRAGIYGRAHGDTGLDKVWREAVLKHGIEIS